MQQNTFLNTHTRRNDTIYDTKLAHKTNSRKIFFIIFIYFFIQFKKIYIIYFFLFNL